MKPIPESLRIEFALTTLARFPMALAQQDSRGLRLSSIYDSETSPASVHRLPDCLLT